MLMVRMYDNGAYLLNGKEIVCDDENAEAEIKSKPVKK